LYLSDGLVGLVAGREGDEGVAAVHAGHRVHHEAEIPDLAALLEQGNQVTLVNVARNLAAENLKFCDFKNIIANKKLKVSMLF
jgi:hypothetical protein